MSKNDDSVYMRMQRNEIEFMSKGSHVTLTNGTIHVTVPQMKFVSDYSV